MLHTQPAGDVTVTVGGVGGADVSVSPAILTFTTGNWDAPRTVTVTAGEDDDAKDEALATITHVVSGYGRVTASSVNVMVTDNDTEVAVSFGSAAYSAFEGGDDAEVTVRLSSPAPSPMVVSITATGRDGATVDDWLGVPRVLTFDRGDTSKSFTVTAFDDTVKDSGEVVELGFGALPDGCVPGAIDTARVTIMNDDGPVLGGAALSIEDSSSREAWGSVVFYVTLSKASSRTVAVDFATADRTALAGEDYVTTSGTLSIPAGDLSATIEVPLVDDSADESHETFTVTLSNERNAAIADASATGTILDGDPAPRIVISAVSVSESSATAELTVTLSSVSNMAVSADYVTDYGTAVGGKDYTTTSGTLSFAAGETRKTIRIEIIDDGLDEADETFAVVLSNIVNATWGYRPDSVTISDDDDLPALSINDVTISESGTCSDAASDGVCSYSSVGVAELAISQDAIGTAKRFVYFKVTLSVLSNRDVTFAYRTVNNDATADEDYVAMNGTLTIWAGYHSSVIMVGILADTTDEPEETFLIVLSNPVHATLADRTAVATITP